MKQPGRYDWLVKRTVPPTDEDVEVDAGPQIVAMVVAAFSGAIATLILCTIFWML